MSNKYRNFKKHFMDMVQPAPHQFDGIDIDREYELIQQKKSNLSAAQRYFVTMRKSMAVKENDVVIPEAVEVQADTVPVIEKEITGTSSSQTLDE